MERLTPVPLNRASFSRLRWSVHALHTKSRGQQTQDARTTRVRPFSRMALKMPAQPSGTQAAGITSTCSIPSLRANLSMYSFIPSSHPRESLHLHTKTPTRISGDSSGSGGENEIPWPFGRCEAPPSSVMAFIAAAKPRVIMA